jgi:hypothetical protein
MLATLAENSNEVVSELQWVVQETRSAGALGAIEKAAEKNPRAAEAADFLRRTRHKFSKDGEGEGEETTSSNSLAIGLGGALNWTSQGSSPFPDWFPHIPGGHLILGALAAYGTYHLGKAILQGQQRRHLVLRAIDGDEAAYKEIHQKATRGDPKALRALRDIAERHPRGVIDLDEIRRNSVDAQGTIEKYFKRLDTQNFFITPKKRRIPCRSMSFCFWRRRRKFPPTGQLIG